MAILLWSRQRFHGSRFDGRTGGYIITKAQLSAERAREARRLVASARRMLTAAEKVLELPKESDDVPMLVRAQAQGAAMWAAKMWGVRPPILKFFDRESREARGTFFYAAPDAVYVRSDLRGDELLDTVHHEVSHYARHVKGLPQSEPEVNADMAHLTYHFHAEQRRLRCYEY
jgi:hypothetical protein